MPDDTDAPVPLRQYLERLIGDSKELSEAKFVTFRVLIDSNSEKVALALAASKEAITKAETAADKRFDSVNEFRAQLTDQAATFVTRRELEQLRISWQERMDELKGRLDTSSGRSGGVQSSWGYLVAAITVGIGVLSLVVVAANALLHK